MLRKWDELPEYMQTDAVRLYYDHLKSKKISLLFKRIFDIIMAVFMLIILFPVLSILSIIIALDSKGGVFFRQERITQYGKKFKILKFRTMIVNAEAIGSQVTVSNDLRVTKVGKILRKFRFDEFPQLVNIIRGDMSFVGTRPEVTKYVNQYTPEMFATLLLPAGVTSEASIHYKDEERFLNNAANADEVYVNKVLPKKMEYNLRSIRKFNFIGELLTMIKTVSAVFKREDEVMEENNARV